MRRFGPKGKVDARAIRSSHQRLGAARFPWVTVLALSTGLAGAGTYLLRDDKHPAPAQTHALSLHDGEGLVAGAPDASLLDPHFALGNATGSFAERGAVRRTVTAAVEAPARITADAAPRPVLASLSSQAVSPSLVPDLGQPDLIRPMPGPASTSLPGPAPLPMGRPEGAPSASLPRMDIPMPMRRPADAPASVQAPAATPGAPPERPQVAGRRGRAGRETAAATPAAPAADNRTFFQRLFGRNNGNAGGEQQMALAYAPSQTETDAPSMGQRLGFGFARAMPPPERGTAIYDISARVVYLPNGERLEAHSGLGHMMDNPRYAHVRMNGPTPPHTYELREREARFHGVRAIRLHPVGGSGAIHGRAGLLAHTYMLGARGDSNGCVSIKDYDRFLQAYLRGEIRRLVVVARRTS